MAITAQKLLPQSKGGSITPIKRGALTTIKPIGVKKSVGGKESSEKRNVLLVIKERTIEIETLLKGSLALDKIRADQARKKIEKKTRSEKEDELEKDSGDKKEKPKGLKLPKVSFFDKIKNFIKNVILGFIFYRLVDFLPQLTKFISFIGPVTDFVLNLGGKLLDGLVTFVDWGYKVYDSARGFIGDKFGDEAQKNFDSLMANVNTMLNLALIAAMGAIALRPKPPKGEKPGGVKPRRGQIVDPVTGKVRKKTKFELELQKKYKLNDDQINAFRKAKQGGANTQQALVQAKKVKPKKPTKPQGFFGKLFEGAKDLAKGVGSGLNKLSGGNLGKLGNFLQDQYKNASAAVRKQYDKVVAVGDAIKNKFGEGVNKLKNAAGNLAEAAKKQIVQKIIEPLKPIFEPILSKLKGIGDRIMKQLSKIPGFDNVMKVLQKNGVKGLDDAKGLLKKVGPKAIPILGGIVNLLFAYDRLAQGDVIGGLLEATSGVLDLSGAFGFVPGPGISMGIDAYLFARDFIPQIQEGENAAVNALGLGGIKGQVEGLAKQLPDLSTIVKMITGKGDPTQPMLGLPRGSDEQGTRQSAGADPTGSGVTAGGATGKGLITGPSSRIGGSAEYHVDTKFHKSLGIAGIVSSMDKLSKEYANKGRMIEMSGHMVAGQKYNHEDKYMKKRNLMRGAIDSHSHSSFMRAEGFLPFDYYIPKANDPQGRFGKSAEGAEILVPDFGGKINVGKLYGGYGKSADIYDASNKWVAMTGHGDIAYMLGGFTKAMAHRAVLGEKGREFVIDADSTAAIESTFPGFLNAINKADGKQAIEILKSYAEYEMPEVIPVPVVQQVPVGGGSYDTAQKSSMISGGRSKRNDPFQEILYMR
jgi:hypothetical protein